MTTVYITEPGVQVHKQGQRLLVSKGKEVLQDIPLIHVDRLVVMGRGVNVTTPAIYALAQRKIDVLYLNSRGGYVSRLVGREHKHSRLRHAQALAVSDSQRALGVARAIVDGKVGNQRVLVQRHAERADWAAQALANMDASRRLAAQSANFDDLRGREGNAARDYFGLLRMLIQPPRDGRSWGFTSRQYYPPPDPINALLSFGYTLLLNDIIAACQVAGLDPDLGFFHTIDYGKPSMALDLEEEFRPLVIDSIVLFAVNRPLFRLEDFETGRPAPDEAETMPEHEASMEKLRQEERRQANPDAARPIYLKEDARKRFIALYETRVNEQVFHPAQAGTFSYRRIFEAQAYHMARVILGEDEAYRPFTVR